MRRRNEVLVGILLTVATIIGVVGTIWLVRGGLESGYPLYSIFRWGENLRTGQPVLLAGVEVGYVESVELRDDGTLFVSMKVQDEYKVPEGTTATVIPVGIFGDAAIALTPLRPSPVSIAEGDTVPTGAPKPGIEALTARADTISQRLDDVARAVQVEFVQQGGIADLRQTVASTSDLVRQLNRLVVEQSRALSVTTASVRRSVAAVDSVRLDSIVENLRATTASTAALTENLEQTTLRLNAVLAKVDSGDGTAARLLNDPGLYNDLRMLVTRMDSLTADIKRNPRRYINLEIF